MIVTDNKGQLEAVLTVDGQTATQVTVTNKYHPQAATVTIPVEKRITGESVPEGEEKEFIFTLEGKADESIQTQTPSAQAQPPMPCDAQDGKCQVKTTGAGKASFGEIQYTSAGTYEYTVTIPVLTRL